MREPDVQIEWRLLRSVTVYGRPMSQGRPRVYGSGGVQADSPRLVDWKKNIEAELITNRGRLLLPLTGPVRVDLYFYFQRQKKQKDNTGQSLPHTTIPDRDNLAKAALDCLERARWLKNDAQITDGRIYKEFLPVGDTGEMRMDVLVPAKNPRPGANPDEGA